MKTIKDILKDYTSGKATLEETNAALTEAEAGYHLVPGKNALTEEEIRKTTIGQYPDMANGFGLLDTGTGTFDKVKVQNGRLVNCDCGSMRAMCIMAGRAYDVKGDSLTAESSGDAPAQTLRKTPDLSRRKDLAGQTVEQRTVAGVFLVTYDELGYAVKSTRK